MGIFGMQKNKTDAPPTDRKPKKNPLLTAYFSSLMSLVMCTTMFLGTTLAWFSSEVTNTGNEIYIGTLEADLSKYVGPTDGASAADQNSENYWVSLKSSIEPLDLDSGHQTLFSKDTVWAPGRTYFETVKVTNQGNLDFNYKMTFTDGSTSDEAVSIEDIAKYFVVYVYEGGCSELPESFVDIQYDSGWEPVLFETEEATLADILNEGLPVISGSMKVGEDDDTKDGETGDIYTIAVHMKDKMDSDEQVEFNALMGKSLKLSVKLVAYQQMPETQTQQQTSEPTEASTESTEINAEG